MSAFNSVMLFLAVTLAITAPSTQARRLLAGRDWGESGDPSGTEVLSRSRTFDGGRGTPTRAVTPENAETTANPGFLGIWRREMGSSTASFATVESDPVTLNPNRQKRTVLPRARSAQDFPANPQTNLVSGNAMIPVLAMGNAAVSQTFEGALSAATSDSITVGGRNSVTGRPTTTANSMLTSRAQFVPKASRAASYGTTAQNAGSVALSGPADGKIALAQANEVAAMSQAASSNADSWQQTRGDVGKNIRGRE